jgi:DNA repair protein RecO (recombination protein O)
MTNRNRVDGQPAFVLHSYPFRETSLIIEVFSRDFGRVALLARGARRPRSALRGLLLAFQPLEISWAGKGEVLTLMKAEWQGGQPLLTGKALFCAYYLNELMIHLLPREVGHAMLFYNYADTLRRFSVDLRESDLRCFERSLLQELGYGLTLEHDTSGLPIDPGGYYAYEIEQGPVRLGKPGKSALSIGGRTLLDLASNDLSDPRSLAEAKFLMRSLISHHTGGKNLETRKIFMELQEL